MNRTLTAVAITFALLSVSGCSGDEGARADDHGGSCPSELLLEGKEYRQTPNDDPLERGAPAGDAQFTTCHSAKGAEANLPAWKVRGVPSSKAFLVEMGGDLELYVSKEIADYCIIKIAKC